MGNTYRTIHSSFRLNLCLEKVKRRWNRWVFNANGPKENVLKSMLDNKMTLWWRIKCEFRELKSLNRRWTVSAIIDFCRYTRFNRFFVCVMIQMIYRRCTIVCQNLYLPKLTHKQTCCYCLCLLCKHLRLIICRISILNSVWTTLALFPMLFQRYQLQQADFVILEQTLYGKLYWLFNKHPICKGKSAFLFSNSVISRGYQ